jgi:hypothetical protein
MLEGNRSINGESSSSELSSTASAQNREPFPASKKLDEIPEVEPTLERAWLTLAWDESTPSVASAAESANTAALTFAFVLPRSAAAQGRGAKVSRRCPLPSGGSPASLSPLSLILYSKSIGRAGI